MRYFNYYKTIYHYVNRSGKSNWIKRVLLKDEEFLIEANEWCELHYLYPKKFPLKRGLKEIINKYAKQALSTQFFVQYVPDRVKERIYRKINKSLDTKSK